MCPLTPGNDQAFSYSCYGSFTLTEKDSGMYSIVDTKPDGYIVLCRTFHTAQISTWIPTPYFC